MLFINRSMSYSKKIVTFYPNLYILLGSIAAFLPICVKQSESMTMSQFETLFVDNQRSVLLDYWRENQISDNGSTYSSC